MNDVLTAFVSVCVAVIVIIFGVTSSTPVVEALAPAAAFALLAVLAVTIERRRYGTFGVASPVSLFAVFWFLYLGVMGPGVFGLSSTTAYGLTTGSIIDGLWLAVLGLLLVFVGYEAATRLVRQPPSKPSRRQYSEDCPRWAIVTILLLGWAATAYLFDKGQIGYLQFGQDPASGFTHLIIRYTSGLVPLSLAALSVVIWSDRVFPSMSRTQARALLWVNIAPLVLVSLASGLKGQLVTSLTPVGIVYVLLRGRIPWKGLLFISLYLIITFGGLQQFRSDIASGRVSSSQTHGVLGPAGQAVSSVTSDWAKTSLTGHVRLFWDNFTAEYSTVPQTIGLIMARTPSATPYLEGRRYLSGPLFFLPASTFQGPHFSLGAYVSVNYRGGTATTANPPTQPGDFFMSGGIPFVIGGEFVVGILVGVLWRRLSPSPARYRATVLYAVIAVDLASAGVDFAALVRQGLEVLIIYGLLCQVVFPRRTTNAVPAEIDLRASRTRPTWSSAGSDRRPRP